MPIWRTVARPIPFWLAGIAPPEILGRETARTAARLHTLPGTHPLAQRLRRPPPREWSRLHALAESQPPPEIPPDEVWLPRLPALRNWLAPGAERQPHRPGQWTLPPESDPDLYWADNKPQSLADQPWHRNNNPYLGLPRKHLARWIGERTGHWDFHSYHDRFNHPPETFRYCIVQALKNEGYTHIQVLRGGGYQGMRIARAGTPDPDDEPLPFAEVHALPGSGGLE
ncbi:hypothetical protein B0H65DRAFT_436166 [Neurospora tetraspora]|uniref:Uncharacterized protein n=1 Tax=Neurospora tetraspora TaxID=94610 RepID=A0AAE0J0K6_9PEZI|nr:hypothetical protein B0H65DRAFT_436166 [Neurospora tetraspora]